MQKLLRYVYNIVAAEFLCILLFLAQAQLQGYCATDESHRYMARVDEQISSRSNPHTDYLHLIQERNKLANQISILCHLRDDVATGSQLLLLFPMAAAVMTIGSDIWRKSRARDDNFIGPRVKKSEPIMSDRASAVVVCLAAAVPVCMTVTFASQQGVHFLLAFQWMLAQSIGAALFICWPLTLIGFGFTLVSLSKAPLRFRFRYLVGLIPLAVSVSSLLWGTYCLAIPAAHHRDSWQWDTLEAMFWSFFPLAVATLYLMRGYRQFTSCLLFGLGVFHLAANFMAGMATQKIRRGNGTKRRLLKNSRRLSIFASIVLK